MVRHPVVIVGAGLAGLQCAVSLAQQGWPIQLLDAADHVGGRVWTDTVDGFLLDRGFQVLNPGYPALKPWLGSLSIAPFVAGARIVLPNGQPTTVANPLRHPQLAWETLFSPVASLADKVALLRLQTAGQLPLNLHRLPPDSVTTLAGQQLPGFVSRTFQQQFFRPFFGGVLLDYDGKTRWDYWLWLYRLFSGNQVGLPVGGMASLPKAMASTLPEGSIHLGSAVTAVAPDAVTLVTGERIPASAVVVATDGHTAARLVSVPFNPGRRGVSCLYYRCPVDNIPDLPILWLNGQGEGLVNNWCFPHRVQPGYAPPGQGLLSVSVLGIPDCSDAELDRLVQAELAVLMPKVAGLSLLRIYRIPFAQPDQVATEAQVPQQVNGVWLAGDWLATPSIQGALASGQHVAHMVANNSNS